MHTLKAYRRGAYFEARELELMNYERELAGLSPLQRIPPDTPAMRAIMEMERDMMR